jgi:hypothetical protein
MSDSAEYANFLRWIDHCAPRPFLLARPDFPGHAELHDSGADLQTIASAIRHSTELVPPERIERYRNEWIKLKSENAAFRLFDAQNIFRSFAIDAFDEALIAATQAEWEPMPEILARTISACWANGRSIPGDLVFCHRIIQLANNSERLKIRGDTKTPMRLELRLV